MSKKRLIDADALYQKMESNLYWGLDSDGAILDTIDEAPTVDAVEVVHGRWIHEEECIRGISDHQHVCSVCGHIYWNARVPNFKYCPYCGAKMDGDANG